MKEIGNTPADKNYQPSGISRAENVALKRFPIEMTPLNYQEQIELFGGKTEVDFNALPRSFFQLGYEQAEKDIVPAAQALVDAVERYVKQRCLRSELLNKTKELKKLLEQ